MFRTLKALFEDRIASFASAAAPGDALPVAVAALMFEIAKADNDVAEGERAAILKAVGSACAVDDSALEALVDTATAAADESVSLYEFTVIINDQLPRAKKVELLQTLWRIARADGRIDHYEEYYIRKIADLLHLSHGDFIRAKLAVEKEA